MPGGAIAGGGHLTIEAGAEMLSEGGSAIDAAVAAAFTCFHAEPLLASAAGGGVMIGGDSENGFKALSFSPTMPGRGVTGRPDLGFRSVWIDFGVSKQEFHVGRGAAAVPTGLVGLYEVHRRWGRMPFRDVITPAIKLCREGLVVTKTAEGFIEILEPIWRLSPESAELYTVDGHRARAGDRITNPNFADMLELLATEGPAPFLTGEIAGRTADAFGPQAGGLITMEDLAAFEPVELEPLDVPAWGGTFLTPPPPTTGGTLVALSLGLLSRLDLRPEDFGTDRHLRAMTDLQLAILVARRELVDKYGRISLEAAREVISKDGMRRHLERLGRIAPDGTPPPDGRGSTTHVSVLDEDGGAAAITVSNGEGCGFVIPGTGMHMNNFLGEDDINPAGFHTLPVGSPIPTMMSPTIYVRDGQPELVLGSGGSNRLRTAITQVAMNRVGLQQPVATSVRAPRIHVEENAFHAEALTEGDAVLNVVAEPFEIRDLFPRRSLYFGGVHAVALERDGSLVGFGDPRRGGAAETVTGL